MDWVDDCLVLPMAFRKMKIDPNGIPYLNHDLTTCISQLALRAEELGEPNTAIVLHALAGHRVVCADMAMALTAREQALLLKTVVEALNKPKNPSL